MEIHWALELMHEQDGTTEGKTDNQIMKEKIERHNNWKKIVEEKYDETGKDVKKNVEFYNLLIKDVAKRLNHD